MRKSLLLIVALLTWGFTFGQLTGVKNVPGAGGPDDYPSIALAITDLNLRGVGPGGVIINVAAGYTETFWSPLSGLLTATGTSGSPVEFRKSGVGSNPVIRAATGTSASTDGIIKIAGGDYITFDGIDLMESPSNTNPTTQMEWGYALVKARATIPVDGCQYITIKNCTITLSNQNSSSSGIYSGNHLHSSLTSINQSMILGAADMHNNCRYYGNTITNVCYGFKLTDVADANQILFSHDNEVGILNAGNTISNLGSSNYQTYGIYVHNQINVKIAYNTITWANTTGNLIGITTRTSNSCEVHHNTISLNSAGSSGVYGIDLQASGTPGNTCDVHDNLIQNCIQSGSGAFTGIGGGSGGAGTMNIYGNTITGNVAGTGTMTLIDGGAAQVNHTYNNLIYNNTKTGAGTINGIRGMYYSVNIHDNQIYSNNVVFTGTTTGSATIYGIAGNNNAQTAENIYNNLIYDLNIQGSTTATSNQIAGVSTDIPSTASRTLYNNVVRNLSISTPSGSGSVYGIRFNNGNVSNVYKNQVYNLSAVNAAGTVYGMANTGSVVANVYNNFISDLNAPGSSSLTAVTGIQIGGGTNVGLYYNTLYLNASSSATTFGSSGVWKSGSGVILDLRNNVIMNASVPGSTGGYTTAMRWSSAYSSSYYSVTSNANNFYAGTPDASHLIYFDGTNSDQTFSGFQTRVSPREALSFTENSPLVNTTTTPYDLHMSTTLPTYCEGGTVAMTSPAITDDFDGNVRSVTPDVGAHEFSGIPYGVVNPTGVSTSVMSSRQINLHFAPNTQNNQVVIVWNNTGYFTTPSGTPPAVNGSFAGGTVLYKGTTSPVNHTGLSGATTYYYKAFSWSGSSYSGGVPVQGTTSFSSPSPFVGYAMAFDRIDLSWTNNVQNHDVIVAVNNSSSFGQPVNGTAYTTGSTLPAGGTVIYAGPLSAFSHTGLTANTTYYYKIWSVDSFSYYSATGSTATVTTMLCAPTSSLPFSEGFETYTAPSVGCGVVIDGNGDGASWAVSTLNPHSGVKSLAISTSYQSNNNDWYFIQGLNLTAGVTYQLSFWFRPQNTYPQIKFEVKWGTTPTPGGMYSAPLYSYTTGTVVGMTQVSCLVTPTVNGPYYFGWHCISDIYPYGSTNFSIDDIAVATNPCQAPLTVTGSGITSTSADIAWTGDATTVQIDYGTAGHAAGSGTLVTATTNPYTLTGLTAMTSYDVYVRKDCGLASYSFWTGPYTFTTSYQAPVVTTDAATAFTGTGATLNGSVNANGIPTSSYFEYGLTTSYGNMITSTPATATGTGVTTVSAALTNLIPNGTTYHYRAVGYSGGVFTYGADMTFVTTSTVPSATTLPATNLSGSGATLNGSVVANNADATVTFEYGTDISYGTTVAGVPGLVIGMLPVNVSAAVSGLVSGTTYHYRVNAVNASGTVNGSDQTFTAAALPVVSTTAASGVTTTTATLNGLVNPNDYTTTVTFRYGTSSAYGTTVTATQSPVSGTSATPVSYALTGLSMNTVYHYQVVGVNAAGTVYGDNMTFTTATIPTVATNAATQSSSGVTMSGTVSANNAPTNAYFEYGLTTAYGTTVAYTLNPFTVQNRTFTSVINSGLLPSTTYNYRAYATNMGGTTYGANMTFTTPVAATVTTVAATPVGTTTATLKGTVNPNGISTAYRFEYGLTTAYGLTTSPSPSSGSGTTTVSLSKAITGLQPNTLYHYRMVGTNAGGPYYGEDMTFTTGPIVAVVTTVAATGVTPVSALLNGTINANFATTTASFEYGLTTSYDNTLAATPSSVSGNTVTGVSASLSGLMPNTTYNYRVNGTNAAGTVNGSNMTFTTLALLPEVTTLGITEPTYTTVTLHGTVNANNAASAVYFEYGLTDGYGSTWSAVPSPVTGMAPTAVSADLTGLTGNMVYHYRVVSVNAAGTSYGADMIFSTVPEPLVLNGTKTDVAGCYGNTNGSISTTVSGGVKPYSYIWSNGATTPSLSGIGAGIYTLTVTDAVNVAVASAWVVTQPSLIVMSASIGAETDPVCSGNAVTYTVSVVNGGSSPAFEWHVNGGPAAGTGSSFNYIPVAGDVLSCVVISSEPCATNTPATVLFTPTVKPWLPVSVSISASSTTVIFGVNVTFTAVAVNAGTNPVYQWYVNGIPSGPNATQFLYMPYNGDQVTCSVTSSEQCPTGNPATSNVITMQTTPTPNSVTIQNLTVHDGQSICIDALDMIQVAGDPYHFTIENGGSALMIAGHRIYLHPGTTVQEGGYLHAYISTEFCGTQAPPISAVVSGTPEDVIISERAEFKVYPNPTKGDFTIELKNLPSFVGARTEIYNMRGEKIFSSALGEGRKFLVRFNETPVGLYFVKIIVNGNVDTFKVIKM